MSELRVIAPGPLATVQDLGRPGHAHLGIPPSGALDAGALRRANRLVGNPDGAAGAELTFGGLRAELTQTRLAAVTGAPLELSVDGRPVPFGAPFELAAGARLACGRPARGMRSYLALAGGLAPPALLGSRATDTLCGLGPPRLAAGDAVPLGAAPAALGRGAAARGGANGTDAARVPAEPEPDWDAAAAVRLHLGPRADWFTEEAAALLAGQAFELSPESNRIAARLRGPALPRLRGGELPSEGLVTGAMQVPAGGQPLIFLADHPTTGGYPVIAVVDPDDLWRVAQARPGAALRFQLV